MTATEVDVAAVKVVVQALVVITKLDRGVRGDAKDRPWVASLIDVELLICRTMERAKNQFVFIVIPIEDLRVPGGIQESGLDREVVLARGWG
jgi:hypothetical protein